MTNEIKKLIQTIQGSGEVDEQSEPEESQDECPYGLCDGSGILIQRARQEDGMIIDEVETKCLCAKQNDD